MKQLFLILISFVFVAACNNGINKGSGEPNPGVTPPTPPPGPPSPPPPPRPGPPIPPPEPPVHTFVSAMSEVEINSTHQCIIKNYERDNEFWEQLAGSYLFECLGPQITNQKQNWNKMAKSDFKKFFKLLFSPESIPLKNIDPKQIAQNLRENRL